MSKEKLMGNIANAINAALKIQSIRNSTLREFPDSCIKPNRIHLINEMLGTIAEYSPENYRNKLVKTVEASNLYFNTYNNLKNHYRATKGTNLVFIDLLKALEIVKPALPNYHKSIIEKIQKIHEVITS